MVAASMSVCLRVRTAFLTAPRALIHVPYPCNSLGRLATSENASDNVRTVPRWLFITTGLVSLLSRSTRICVRDIEPQVDAEDDMTRPRRRGKEVGRKSIERSIRF